MATFLERFFYKSIPSDISYEDLRSFLKQGIEEHQNLDYKSGEILTGYKEGWIKNGKLVSDEGFVKLAAVVAGFANAEGGLLVLGVRERQEKINGKIVKKRPGAIYPLPDGLITKEMIASKLRSLIQFPIDDLTIVPLRSSNRSKNFVCLIDIPPSIRVPHRVNEQEYYQRYQFETKPMLHYQINDLFGKRFGPSLDLQLEIENILGNEFTLSTVICNYGRAIAKYPMCLWKLDSGDYSIIRVGPGPFGNKEPTFGQYIPGANVVVYPYLHLRIHDVRIRANSSDSIAEPIVLECTICAELSPAIKYNFKIYPSEQRIELINKFTVQQGDTEQAI